ncbi:MAG: hypothetical protein GQE15_06310 [Archangiaceae bacterium]|nr:hypothetical protein [Archangiaceae bacterium]
MVLACVPKRETAWAYAKSGTCTQPAMPVEAIPDDLRACRVDSECLKAATDGCCSHHVGAVRADFLGCVLPATGGVNCDQVCDRVSVTPPNALTLSAVCVKGRCELR